MWRISDVWQYTADATAISNDYFDDNTDGTGHPGGDLKSGQYGVAWVYIHPSDSDVYVVYGRDSYKLAEAEQAQPPGDIPMLLSAFGLLIGCIIIEEGESAFAVIQSVTDLIFSGTAVADHGALGGLDDVSDHPGYVTKALFDANTILAADSDDTPAALEIAEQRIIGRITSGNIIGLTAAEVLTLIGVTAGADVTADNETSHADVLVDGDFDENSILASDGDDSPTVRTIAVQQIVGRITAGNIKGLTAAEVLTLIGVTAGADPTAANETSHTDVLVDGDYGANSILAADTVDTPASLEIAEQRVVGRITGGNIIGLTAAEILTLIGVTAGADVSTTSFAFFMS